MRNAVCILYMSFVSAGFGATTFHVSPSGSHNPPFSGISTAATNIQSAVDLAMDGDTVLIHDGHYVLTNAVEVSGAIRIESENGAEHTIVDGNATNRCFYLADEACTVSGLTITNGYIEDDYGGGVYCDGSAPVVVNCVITHCSALGGGAMYDGILINSIVRSNEALEWSGGMDSGVASNCLFVGNHCGFDGGAASLCRIVNCTVVGNSADGEYGGGGGVDTCISFNSIIYSNTALSGFDDISNIDQLEYCCSPDVPTHGVDGNITNNPVFADTAVGNYRLQTNSPCINAGSNVHVGSAFDLDGNSRIVRIVVDMGAYEYPFPEVDTDDDGMTDFEESIAGTNPTNPASYFAITNWSVGSFIIEWPAFSNRQYQVYRADSLTNAFNAVGGLIYYPQNSYTDSVLNASGFYKVEVQLQP